MPGDFDLTSDDLCVLHHNIVSLTVCVPKDWDKEKIQNAANIAYPTGIGSRWQLSEEFPAPTPCTDAPEDRVHILLEC